MFYAAGMAEPSRSRTLVIGLASAAALIAVASALANIRWGMSPEAIPCVAIVFVIIADLAQGVWFWKRPKQWRFWLVPGGFDIPMPTIAYKAGALFLFTALIVARVSGAVYRGDVIEAAVFGFVGLLISASAVVAAIFAARGMTFRLTPDGIEQRLPLFRRLIPWAALAPGGPPPPRAKPVINAIELAVTDPSLIQQSGGVLGAGTPQRPYVPHHTPVHPWLLAGAIRWYAEHPEHRAAIGTQAEHDRLIAAVAKP